MSYVLFTWSVEKVCSNLTLIIVLSCFAHGKVRKSHGIWFLIFCDNPVVREFEVIGIECFLVHYAEYRVLPNELSTCSTAKSQ